MQIPEIRFDCSVTWEKLIFLCFAFTLVLKLGIYKSICLCLTIQVSYPQFTLKWFNSDLLWFCLAEFQSACKEGALLHAYHWLDVVFPRDRLLQAQVGGGSENSRTEVAQSPGLPWKLLGEWWWANGVWGAVVLSKSERHRQYVMLTSLFLRLLIC